VTAQVVFDQRTATGALAFYVPSTPQRGVQLEVERHLTGKETEAWEIIYFKLYTSQLPVVEKAIEAVGLMLGTDKLLPDLR
jgi:hypothetical protein